MCGFWAVGFCLVQNFIDTEKISEILVYTEQPKKLAAVLVASLYVLQFSGFWSLPFTTLLILAISTVLSLPNLQQAWNFLNQLEVETLRPKALIYPTMMAAVMGAFTLRQVVDTWQQESDYFTDYLLSMCVACMWMTQPRHLRYRDLGPIITLVLCSKATYFIDRESSLNFQTPIELQS